MIQSYQEEIALLKETEPLNSQDFATIGTVSGNTATLIFDDSTGESTKYYRSNKSITFVSGDRVKIFKSSGTYIIEYPI